MEALSFVLSLSLFPPKESYSVVQDAEERREKGVTMNSILNSLWVTSFDWFFFLTFEEKSEKSREKRKREKENSKKNTNTNTDTKEKENFSHVFGRKMPHKLPTISLKTSESTYYFVGKFSLTTNDALLERRLIKRE